MPTLAAILVSGTTKEVAMRKDPLIRHYFYRKLGRALASGASVILVLGNGFAASGSEPVLDIGSRLELFVDQYLIQRMEGVRLQLRHPRPAETAIEFDRPWEGSGSAFPVVVKDGQNYHMYYRGMVWNARTETMIESTCYAASSDGIRWSKPNLGRVEIMGTQNNNALFDSSGFSPFLDSRPGVPPTERFKAVKAPPRSTPEVGSRILVSGDGIHWRKLHDRPSIEGGPLFWSEAENCYVAFGRSNVELGLKIRRLGDDPGSYRSMLTREGEFSILEGDQAGDDAFRYSADGGRTWKRTGVIRTVRRAVSTDLVHWSDWQTMQFSQNPPTVDEQLYTNATQPYFRAPHLYIALAARFLPGQQALSDAEGQSIQPKDMPWWTWKNCSDSILLTSRGGNRYDRTFPEAFLRPGPGPENWGTRTNFPGDGIVPTSEEEISFYVTRHYELPSDHVRRYTLRVDGFASLHADYEGGEMVTRPLRFQGKELVLNFSTSAAGSLRVEIQDAENQPIPGFRLDDCPEIIGDKIQQVVRWMDGSDLSRLEGRVVRLRFAMKDADLFSIRFSRPES